MARQIIDIGVQGNDGTGDSIRESFRKVNDNFTQLFAVFGSGDRITFTDLDDTPAVYGPGQLIIANNDGDRLVAKTLVAGPFITIDNSDPNEITIEAQSGSLSGDTLPTLSRPMNAGGFGIGNLEDPDNALSVYNTIFPTNQLPDSSSFAVSKGYADQRYFNISNTRTTTGLQIRLHDEPLSNSEYVKTVSDWIGGYARIPGHGYTSNINGTAVVYRRVGGTTDASGIVSDGTVYYLRFFDGDNLALYSSKADALLGDDLNRILVNDSPSVPAVDRGVETIEDAGWDGTLSGNWLSDEAIPRKSVVRRQGDTMTGLLTLSGNPVNNLHAATKQYVDSAQTAAQTYAAGYYTGGTGVSVSSGSISIGQAVGTTSNVTFNNLTVSGDLTVNGTTTTLNTATLNVEDNIITLNSNVTGTPSANAGIEIERGTSNNTQLRWNESTDTWQQTRDGSTYYNLPISTDELSEGSTNQYYTDTRSYTKIKSVLRAGAKVSLTANDGAETITVSVTGGTGGFDLSENTTDDLAEGTGNLYFLTSRARASVSATNSGTGYGGLAYDSGTGVFTYTRVTDANIRGRVSATNTSTGYGGLAYDSGTGVFTYTRVTDDNIRSAISAGTGITITAGQIATTITQYTDTNARLALSSGAGINYNSSTGQISSAITQYTDALARLSISRTINGTGFGDLDYDTGTGVFTFTPVTTSEVRSSFSAGSGISIVDGVISTTGAQYTDSNARAALSVTNSGTGYGDLSYSSSTGVFTYTRVTDTNIRERFSAGFGISYNSSTGQISSTITQYTDLLAAAAARSAVSATNSGTGYGGLSYDSGTGAFTFARVTDANIRSAISAGTDISITSGQISVTSSTTATNDSIVKRTSTGSIAATRFNGHLVSNVQSLVLGASGQTLTASQITGNIITVALTANADLMLPNATNMPGAILIVRNQSTAFNLTVEADGSPPTVITTLTPAAQYAQIASDGIDWLVL